MHTAKRVPDACSESHSDLCGVTHFLDFCRQKQGHVSHTSAISGGEQVYSYHKRGKDLEAGADSHKWLMNKVKEMERRDSGLDSSVAAGSLAGASLYMSNDKALVFL